MQHLHLKFALNLENLADEMIDAVSKAWTTPFEAPVVIFPDPKLEQWFRLKWVQKKKSLIGFKSMMIDRFLMEILIGDDKQKQKLHADMLRNVILAYLVKETDGTPNYMRMDDEVKRYLVVDGKLDETHLFDFASKMASLFLEYETSRPSEFISGTEGFLDKWKQDHLNDFFGIANPDIAKREAWQRELYSAIFHKHGDNPSLLTEVFENEAKRKGIERTDYLTIPYLYEACKEKGTKNVKFHTEHIGNTPLFIFGLGGMGQFYRVILQKYAETHDVYVYIQNPCMEFWEDASTVQNQTATVHRKWQSSNGQWSDNGENLDSVCKKMSLDYSNAGDNTDIDDISEYKNEEAESENTLLCNWGRSGRDNIKLWCQAADYDFGFSISGRDGKSSDEISDASELPQDTLLHKVQYAIANRQNTLPNFTASDCKAHDFSLDITAAPTKIREIEALHTNISKLMQNGARVNDILVVSPALDDYRTAIKTIFDQTPEKKKYAGENEKEGFLHIPFAIVDSPARSSLTENVLENLFAILEQGTITRPTFFELLRNPVVQLTRHITDDDVSNWESWIEATNVYRDREQKKEDWLSGVRRLLLAKMTKNPVEFSNDEFLPYADMATSDSNSLCKFVECIDSLKKWMEFAGCKQNEKHETVCENRIENLDKLCDFINEWLSMASSPDGFASERIIVNNVTQGIEGLRNQMDAGLQSISWKVVKQTLLNAAQSSAYSCGSLFVNGITFMNFIPNRIIPVKHLFFIGGDSMNFPGAKQQNTLDLRKSCRPWPGDDSPIAKRRYAFLCQLMSTSESFHISYVNQDIRKDAELYPTSIVNDIRKFLINAVNSQTDASGEKVSQSEAWPENKISLDETRDFGDLFTQKSLRNKRAFLNMMQDGYAHANPEADAIKSASSNIKAKLPERVSIYKLSDFLKDPFQFRISQMLADSDSEDPEKEMFEPIQLDNLKKSTLLKMTLAAELSNKSDELDKFKKESKLKGGTPDGVFGDKLTAEIEANKKIITDNMGKDLVQKIKDSWSYQAKIEDIQFERSDSEKWTLSGSLDWSDSSDLDKITEMISITSSDKKPTIDKFLTPYIRALAVIAQRSKNAEIQDQVQNIKISIFHAEKGKKEPATSTISMTPKSATEMLQKIYTAAFGNKEQSPYFKAVPAKLTLTKDINNIRTFKEKLLYNNGPWEYFSKKTLFDPITDVGFDANNFTKQWKEAIKKMDELMLFSREAFEKSKSKKESTKSKTSKATKKKA